MPVLSITGDGGFMFTANELATAVRHRIPLVAIVFNDGAFGNVRRIQEERYGNRLIASDLANPDFVSFAESFGAAAERARNPEELARGAAARLCPPRADPDRGAGRADALALGVHPHAAGARPTMQAGCHDSKPGSVRLRRSMELITTTEELAEACARMARHPFVTVDTEFLRETTYYPLLCVAQMASTDEAVVIDALAPGIDLAPFFDLMANEKVLKVFHAARQDIEIVWHMAEIIPHPIFDTQVAAMVLGYGDSISYDQLVQRITGDKLDKSHRFTDWTRRPLSDAQITYAISDVTHLRDVYITLAADLARRGRTDWVEDEMEVLTSPDTYRAGPGARLGAPQDAGAQAEGARRADRGRGLARARGADPRRAARARAQGRRASATSRCRRRPRSNGSAICARCRKGFERSRWGEEIIEAVKRGLARDPKTLPRIERPARRPTARPPSSCSRCCCA